MTLCGCGRPANKTGSCRDCHCRNLGRAKKNPRWTAEHDAMLRKCYAVARRRDLVKAITEMARRTGFPRTQVYSQARRLGLTFIMKRRWTQEEIDYLNENRGVTPTRVMAKVLQRSVDSILIQLTRMGASGRVVDGYTGRDVAGLFGIGWELQKAWERRGLMKRGPNGRFTDETILNFIKRYPHEYDLRRVDQTWFKGLVFGYQVQHDFDRTEGAA